MFYPCQVSISVIYPTGNINVNQNEFFNVTLNVSCVAGVCGTVNVSLDPEIIEEIIRGQVNFQVDEEEKINNKLDKSFDNSEIKSFFERVVEFFRRKIMYTFYDCNKIINS